MATSYTSMRMILRIHRMPSGMAMNAATTSFWPNSS